IAHSNSNLETDDGRDFSMMTNRRASFRDSNLVQQVSAERLAQAGFYFIGPPDRVRCFSCQKTVENWHTGDTPVERHKEVSPSCKFLSCNYRTSLGTISDTTLTNGSSYNEAAEDMEYLLRTGQVVDESTYPLAPHMKSEEARLNSFISWPPTVPIRPGDLAQAGLYYLGTDDRVQCFCCNGILAYWEEGDDPWEEHAKHFPSCFFILGHDVGNIPFQGMGTFEERLASFAGAQHPVDREKLARAGFYRSGDKVLCFCCGGGLKGWQPDEDPWEEHAKHYPGCRFLLEEKGQEFVNSIQLQGPRRNRANGFSGVKIEEDPLEKLQRLQREKQCKICMERDICMVFIPCGHLVSCDKCSVSLVKCPICCGAIAQKVKTYIT
uniref:E3 ubiquitin-protein ligase XIAP n=1 Tax=Mola mola TaxID=94237 RepID=A0A3Q4B4A0_MOLML